MPGRQSPLRPTEDRDEGTKADRAYMRGPHDLPAPSVPSVPQRADGANPSHIGVWLIRHGLMKQITDAAHADWSAGQDVPDELITWVKGQLHQPASDNARTDVRVESLEVAKTMATVSKAAELSGLSRQRLRCLAATSRVRAQQDVPGGPWLVDLASVEEYLRSK